MMTQKMTRSQKYFFLFIVMLAVLVWASFMGPGQAQAAPYQLNGCEQFWTPNRPGDMTGYVISFGETPGGPYMNTHPMGSAQMSVSCSDLGFMKGRTYYSVLDAQLLAGGSMRSPELMTQISQDGLSLTYCSKGFLKDGNNTPAQSCVTVTADPTP